MVDWQIIIEKHGLAVWQTAYKLLGNSTDAADCFQETFVSALELSRRQRIRSFSTLLVRLATTRAIDQLRRRFRRSQCNAASTELSAVPSANPGPVQMAQQRELIGRLRMALTQLPPAEARVFCLRYLNDMSYRQIAKALDIKTNAAGVLLHRARAKLQKSFELSKQKEQSEVVL